MYLVTPEAVKLFGYIIMKNKSNVASFSNFFHDFNSKVDYFCKVIVPHLCIGKDMNILVD